VSDAARREALNDAELDALERDVQGLRGFEWPLASYRPQLEAVIAEVRASRHAAAQSVFEAGNGFDCPDCGHIISSHGATPGYGCTRDGSNEDGLCGCKRYTPEHRAQPVERNTPVEQVIADLRAEAEKFPRDTDAGINAYTAYRDSAARLETITCCEQHLPGDSRRIHELEHVADAANRLADAVLNHIEPPIYLSDDEIERELRDAHAAYLAATQLQERES
jgi:hypothetical protein